MPADELGEKFARCKNVTLAVMFICFVAYFYPILFFIPALFCFFIYVLLSVLEEKAEKLTDSWGNLLVGASAVGLFRLLNK